MKICTTQNKLFKNPFFFSFLNGLNGFVVVLDPIDFHLMDKKLTFFKTLFFMFLKKKKREISHTGFDTLRVYSL